MPTLQPGEGAEPLHLVWTLRVSFEATSGKSVARILVSASFFRCPGRDRPSSECSEPNEATEQRDRQGATLASRECRRIL